jgi:mannose-1-phosphate guanylyltransferase/phosphomannomutase
MHRSPRMIKRAIISGLPSAGVDVWDLGSQPIPVARYYTRVSGAQGGVHVRLSPFDERVVDIRLMDDNGLNLNQNRERDVERVFFREDFRRVYLDDIGSIEYAPRVKERYVEDFLKHLNTRAIQEAGFHLVVDFAGAPVASVLPSILDQLHCHVIALNANTDKPAAYLNQSQFHVALKQMQIITTALETQLGVRLDTGGEKIFLVDDRGFLLESITACAAMVDMALQNAPRSSVTIPLNLPNIFEKIAQRYEGQIIRTEVDVDSLIKATCTESVVMSGDGEGNFIFPEFQCAVDGLMALAKLLEFLATQKTALSEVVSNLPHYYVAERKVPCPWEAKARVMRLIYERFDSYKNQVFNGVKVELGEDRWILMTPDPDHPSFRVATEGISQGDAESLADEFARVIETMTPSE